MAPTLAVKYGDQFRFGNFVLRVHHYGTAHAPSDICIEIVNDKVVCVGDVAMDRSIANMDDGSFRGSLATYDSLEKNTRATLWIPGHGNPSGDVLNWNRDLFAGIYQTCVRAVAGDLPLEAAKSQVLKDPRVESKAVATNIGKYVSLAYLEAEAAAF